jgi:hypothetical protein
MTAAIALGSNLPSPYNISTLERMSVILCGAQRSRRTPKNFMPPTPYASFSHPTRMHRA